MSSFSQIDLSKLPPPNFLDEISYDDLLSEMKEKAGELFPELIPALKLDSEPVVKLLQVCAYLRMHDRQHIRDQSKSNMLALATGTALDHIAARYLVKRLTIQAANEQINPPTPLIMEGDEAFRKRIQLSTEGYSNAGPRGAYMYHAYTAGGAVKDVSVYSVTPGQVDIRILSHIENGVASNTLLSAINAAVNDENIRPLCDTVIVKTAEIIDYEINAKLILYDGPGAGEVLATANTALNKFTKDHHKIGHDITASGIYAALHQPGVQNVIISNPSADIIISNAQAAFCKSTNIVIGGRDV